MIATENDETKKGIAVLFQRLGHSKAFRTIDITAPDQHVGVEVFWGLRFAERVSEEKEDRHITSTVACAVKKN